MQPTVRDVIAESSSREAIARGLRLSVDEVAEAIRQSADFGAAVSLCGTSGGAMT